MVLETRNERPAVLQLAREVGQVGVKAAWDRLCQLQDSLLQSRERSQGNIAVIDIGSNSVRLVIFDGVSRAPLPLFNEKVLCGLGKGVGANGKLAEESCLLALESLERFVHLGKAMGAREIAAFATAAIRDAENGPAFLDQVRQRCGIEVRLLSGIEEAHYSALGVLAGAPEATGLMGDLGGGSLELVHFEKQGEDAMARPGTSVTLPLGLLRLTEDCGGKAERAREIIRDYLDGLDWLPVGGEFHPVGGAWRNLARIHMGRTSYPLHVIHQYRLDYDEAMRTIELVQRMSRSELSTIRGVSKKRLDTLPFAALLLECILEKCRPHSIVFSAHGVREGILFDRLNPDMCAVDPLIEMCYDISHRESRFDSMGNALLLFSDGIFPDEDPEWRRLRFAACLLGDIGWRVHPDYRAEQSFERVLQAPFCGVDHIGRAWIAVAVFARYGGDMSRSVLQTPRELLHADSLEKAVMLGRVMRLGFAYSGATPSLLREAALVPGDNDMITLTIPEKEKVLASGMVRRRLDSLAKAMGRRADIGCI